MNDSLAHRVPSEEGIDNNADDDRENDKTAAASVVKPTEFLHRGYGQFGTCFVSADDFMFGSVVLEQPFD